MAIPTKELEPIGQNQEEIALQEVEGYIEQVEKAPELDQDGQLQPAPSQTPTPPPVTDDQTGQVVMQPADSTPAPIHLPLNQAQVQEGLHHRLMDSIRWLAEFCVYLIKKYPGRVFYPPSSEVSGEQVGTTDTQL
jgi:hypothetical protein